MSNNALVRLVVPPRDDHIEVAPTLSRQSPLPLRRLVGDLSQTKRIPGALELSPSSHHP